MHDPTIRSNPFYFLLRLHVMDAQPGQISQIILLVLLITNLEGIGLQFRNQVELRKQGEEVAW